MHAFQPSKGLVKLSLVLLALAAPSCGPVQTACLPPEPDASAAPQPRDPARSGPLYAGAARVDATPSMPVPLAGYGDLARRSLLPDINPFNQVTFFRPSSAVRDPIHARALVLHDGTTTLAFLALDLLAVDAALVEDIRARAAAAGLALPPGNLLVCASHTHSGPGGMTDLALWSLLAVDAASPSVRDPFIDRAVDALIQARDGLRPARIGSACGSLPGVAFSRRSRQDVAPPLGVIRIDGADSRPLAVLWNFAIHGTALGPDNLRLSADVMGAACARIEENCGCIALFANGAAGDVSPARRGEQGLEEGGTAIADEVLRLREAAAGSPETTIRVESALLDMGPGELALSPQRLGETAGDGVCARVIHYAPGVAWPLNEGWIDTRFRLHAVRLGDDLVLVTVPGEPTAQLGEQIRFDAAALGFGRTFVLGLTGGYMSYLTTEEEYWEGGYEAQAVLWGPAAGAKVRDACFRQMIALR